MEKLPPNPRNSPEKLYRRKLSESDNSSSRRRSVYGANKVKSFDISTSSSSEQSDVEYDIKQKLSDSKNNLEKTEALRLGRKLLRPEDYVRSKFIPSYYDSIDLNFVYNKMIRESSQLDCSRECVDGNMPGAYIERDGAHCCYYYYSFVILLYILILIIVTNILLYIENIKSMT